MEVGLNNIQEINYWKEKFINTDVYKTTISNITIDLTWVEKHISFHLKKADYIVGFNIDCRFILTVESPLTEDDFKLALKNFTDRIKEYHDTSK